jgi:hypothetical protein
MTELQARIAELETKAAEFELIAELAADPDTRARNSRLAQEIYEQIDKLRTQHAA